MTGVVVPVKNTSIGTLPAELDLYPNTGAVVPKPTSVDTGFPSSEMSRLSGASGMVCTTRYWAGLEVEPQLGARTQRATSASAKSETLNGRDKRFSLRRAVLM